MVCLHREYEYTYRHSKSQTHVIWIVLKLKEKIIRLRVLHRQFVRLQRKIIIEPNAYFSRVFTLQKACDYNIIGLFWAHALSPVNPFIIPLRKNKTIFGKDQRTQATWYISYPTLNASKRIISGPWVHRNVPFHIKGGMKKYIGLG